MTQLLAIDPGADLGWALFVDAALKACGLGSPPDFRPHEVAIEHPVIYPGRRTKNPNDVLKVAIIAGEVAGKYRALGATIRYIEPRSWKGTIDPDVVNARAEALLGPLEAMALRVGVDNVPARKRHNVIDAVGLGLFALGRFAQ